MKQKIQGITQEDVRKALQRFQAAGRLITKLPDEIPPARNLVGAKWALYEEPSFQWDRLQPERNLGHLE